MVADLSLPRTDTPGDWEPSVWARRTAPLDANAKRYWACDHVASALLARALDERGWMRARAASTATFVLAHELRTLRDVERAQQQPLQRVQVPNHVWQEESLANKAGLYAALTEFANSDAGRGVDVDFLPETYVVSMYPERMAFRDAAERTRHGPELSSWWVAKRAWATDTDDALSFITTAAELDDFLMRLHSEQRLGVEEDVLAQRYVNNQLLTPDGRRFDVRSFVLVASVEPLLVLMRHGYVHAAAPLSEDNQRSGARAHAELFTNPDAQPTQNGAVGSSDRRYLMPDLEEWARAEAPTHPDPLSHIWCQMRRSVAVAVEAARAAGIFREQLEHTDNAFTVFGADFVVDRDLKVWLMEMEASPSLPPMGTTSRSVWEQAVPEMMDIVTEVHRKQLAGHKYVRKIETRQTFEPIVMGNRWNKALPQCN